MSHFLALQSATEGPGTPVWIGKMFEIGAGLGNQEFWDP